MTLETRTSEDILSEIREAFGSACAIRNGARAIQIVKGVVSEIESAIHRHPSHREFFAERIWQICVELAHDAFEADLPIISEAVWSVMQNFAARCIQHKDPTVSSIGLDIAAKFVTRCLMLAGSENAADRHYISDVFVLQFYLVIKKVGIKSPHFERLFVDFRNCMLAIILSREFEGATRGVTYLGDILLIIDKESDASLRDERLRLVLGTVHRIFWAVFDRSLKAPDSSNRNDWRTMRHAIVALGDIPRIAVEMNAGEIADDYFSLTTEACRENPTLLEACRYRVIQNVCSVLALKEPAGSDSFLESMVGSIKICLEGPRYSFAIQNLTQLCLPIKAAVGSRNERFLTKLVELAISNTSKSPREEIRFSTGTLNFILTTYIYLSHNGFEALGKQLAQASAPPKDKELKISSEMLLSRVLQYYQLEIDVQRIDELLSKILLPLH